MENVHYFEMFTTWSTVETVVMKSRVDCIWLFSTIMGIFDLFQLRMFPMYLNFLQLPWPWNFFQLKHKKKTNAFSRLFFVEAACHFLPAPWCPTVTIQPYLIELVHIGIPNHNSKNLHSLYGNITHTSHYITHLNLQLFAHFYSHLLDFIELFSPI